MTDQPPHETPEREEFTHDPIDHATVWGGMSVGDLADEYAKAGIGADDLNSAVSITARMFADDDVTVLMGLAGAMVPAGMRTIISDLLADGYIDALVTTGATLTHDAIEAIGGHHHHGRPRNADLSAREHDEQLRDEEVDRIYDVYLPQEHFADLESHLRERVFPECEGATSIQSFTERLGVANAAANETLEIDGDPGIAAMAAAEGVPVYCPAIQDSILGLQAWMHSQTSSFTLDALADMTHLNDLAYDAESAGALVVGGGVPKNYVLQSMLVVPDAYRYAVQLTMDPEATGGLSGASLDEARSWGKLEPEARNATVVGDATITLPFLIAAAREQIDEEGRSG